MNATHDRAKSIFLSAAEIVAAGERRAFIEAECAGDESLRGEVEELLRHQEFLGSFLEGPAFDLAFDQTVVFDGAISERPGTVIGPYKLLQQIGEGGFGVVFLAEQERPVKRRVALKVIKPGMDTREVIVRFEAERQALAMMDHPNIAKVLDAGTTVEGARDEDRGTSEVPASVPPFALRSSLLAPHAGRPYFVMELVQGVPITEYCDKCNLTTRERLELFVTVCQAVQHAHQKGVIHRDLKPTNVLVAIQDGRPAPKIIDFGVAKAINQQLTEHTLLTAFAQIVGTPLYMSPEQAELSPLGVDTRSDIYSLGVLLYELLTSTTPFDKERLQAASYDELRRIIREEEPPPPSARLSTLAADRAATVADHRRTDTRRLRQAVRGELDWIVMKCLEKDRNRRYESAGSLARDVERYLHDEPVQACPPSFPYRVKKFIRRNKVGALAGSAVVLALVAGLTLAMAGFMQARHQARISAAEAAKATAISELLQTALQSANPDQAKGNDYTVRQLLDDFAGGFADQLIGQPEVEAEIRATIGNSYRRLGLRDLAAPQFEAALALRRRIGGTDVAEYADILVDYAQNLAELYRITEAERTAREAIRIYRRAGVTGRPLVKALWILQLQLAFQVDSDDDPARGRSIYAEEQAIVQEALAIAEANKTEYPELANMLHRHAPLMSKQGDPAGAEECARRAVAMHRRVHSDEHPETAFGLADLGRVLLDRKKYREAETAFREAMSIFGRYYGDEDFGGIREELNRAINAQKNNAEPKQGPSKTFEAPANAKQSRESLSANRSLRLAQEALQRELRDALNSVESLTADAPTNNSQRLVLAVTYRQVAEIDLNQGKIDRAIENLSKATEITSRLVGDELASAAYAEERTRCRLSLADALAGTNRVDEFLEAFDQALDANDEAISLFPDQTLPLTSESCVRLVSALRESAQRDSETAEQAHRLFGRALAQKVNFTSGNLRLAYADLYSRVGHCLIGDPAWSAELSEVENRFLAILQEVLEKFPGEMIARERVGHKLRLWAFALQREGEFRSSVERALLQAISVYEKLTVDFPDNLYAWHFLADTHCHLGIHHERGGKINDAEAAHRRAVTLFDGHAGKFDATPVNNSERARGYFELAHLLAREKRSAEAEPYFRKARDVLENSSGVDADVIEGFARFAYYSGTNHQEELANEFIKEAVLSAPRISESNTLADALYFVALAQLRLRNEAGYRATCKALLEVPYSHLDSAMWRPIWTPCLAPDSLEDLSPLVTRAEEYVASSSQSQRHFGLYLLGAALYRTGQYEQAAERLEESGVAYESNPLPSGAQFEGRNYQQLLLAMAKWQLGQQDDARRLLVATRPAVDAEEQSPYTRWNRRATLELLRQEAEAMIEQKEADEAVEKESRTSQPQPLTTDD